MKTAAGRGSWIALLQYYFIHIFLYKIQPEVWPCQQLFEFFVLQYGHDEVVKALIAAGAQVNSRNKDGRTPLYKAVSSFHSLHF